MQQDPPTDQQSVRCAGLTFRLEPRSTDGKSLLAITAEHAADPLHPTTYKLDVPGEKVAATTHTLCQTVAHLAEGVGAALRQTNGWTAAVTVDAKRQQVRVTVRHALGFRDVEFELVLSGEQLNVSERLDQVLRVVGPRTNDLLADRHPNIDQFHGGLGAVVARPCGLHASVTTGVEFTAGQHYLEWRLLRCLNNACMLGVAEYPLQVFTPYPGSAALTSGRSLYGHNGHLYRDGANAPYGLGVFGPGEYVGVLLDMDARTVAFSINGRLGDSLPLSGKGGHCFVATLYTQGDAIELLPQHCWHRYAQ